KTPSPGLLGGIASLLDLVNNSNMGSGSSKPKKTRIVIVFGATGSQGGSVISSLRTDSGLTVKAVTKYPESDKAKELSESGIEIITADQDDVDSLKLAINGAYGVGLEDVKDGAQSEPVEAKHQISSYMKTIGRLS
ncbi:hypothetical protein LSH36_1168g00050, partial [Paralvinella palmiformis]